MMGLEIVAQMIAAIGTAAKGTAAELKAAASEARAYSEAASTAGMTPGTGTKNTYANVTAVTDLGNPRDAVDQGMRIYAAIEAAKRR